MAGWLLHTSLVNGYRGRFYNAQKLLDELYASLADRSTPKLIKRFCNYPILLIDELGYLTLKAEQINAFFKLMGERYGKSSTIITTNLDYPDWYDLFQRKTLVDALLDRLKHHCITITSKVPLYERLLREMIQILLLNLLNNPLKITSTNILMLIFGRDQLQSCKQTCIKWGNLVESKRVSFC